MPNWLYVVISVSEPEDKPEDTNLTASIEESKDRKLVSPTPESPKKEVTNSTSDHPSPKGSNSRTAYSSTRIPLVSPDSAFTESPTEQRVNNITTLPNSSITPPASCSPSSTDQLKIQSTGNNSDYQNSSCSPTTEESKARLDGIDSTSSSVNVPSSNVSYSPNNKYCETKTVYSSASDTSREIVKSFATSTTDTLSPVCGEYTPSSNQSAESCFRSDESPKTTVFPTVDSSPSESNIENNLESSHSKITTSKLESESFGTGDTSAKELKDAQTSPIRSTT